jgi:isopenicillin N synthase-like dioxygenase
MDEIPIIDFGLFDSDPKAVAAAIREACESIGFLFLKNIGIPRPEIDEIFELVSFYPMTPRILWPQHLYEHAGKRIFRSTS